MKPQFEKIQLSNHHSFLVKRFTVPYFDAPLHYHPEYELTLILQGKGKRFVGDNVENFEENDLVLIGSNLPHFWSSDPSLNKPSEAIVIQFSQDFIENCLQKIPECQNMIHLLHLSKRGIKFTCSQAITQAMMGIVEQENLAKIMYFFLLFDTLLQENNFKLLSNLHYQNKPNTAETERMNRILAYTLAHFQESISLENIANVAHLTVASFCRYFKQRTRKTYTEYVNDIRLSHACKLLIDNELSISQVGLESGFDNLSNFHRIFKKKIGKTPLSFRNQFEQ